MTAIMKSIHHFEDKFDRTAEHFVLRHPCLSIFIMFIGVPFFILASVAAFTTLFALPAAWLFALI